MTKNEIKKVFSGFDREAYADWLWRGLFKFYTSPSSNGEAFAPVCSLIRQQETLSEGLAQVYEEYISADKQLLFRQAIGDVLRDHSNIETVPMVAFQDLIYLIARIRAIESLGALLPTVGSGLLGKQHPEILYDSFSILKYLAPSSSAFDTVFALVNSSNFDDGYLFEAMSVLIECEPSRTSEIVLRLEPRITQLRKDIWTLDDEERAAFCEAADEWCEHALKFGSRTWLSELWEKAKHSTDQIWLFELLFGNQSIPVYLIENIEDIKTEPIIEYAGKRIKVKLTDEDIWTRRHIARLSGFRKFTQLDFTSLDNTKSQYVLSGRRGSSSVSRAQSTSDAVIHNLGCFVFGQSAGEIECRA